MPIDYDNLKHDPFSESIVDALVDRVGKEERSFFRVHTAYYLGMVASMMRTTFVAPGTKADLANIFAINLAPSGWGKGHATSILETEVIDRFKEKFKEQTLPLQSALYLPKLAVKRAKRKGTDPDEELPKLTLEHENLGSFMFVFDEATPAAIKQQRTMLLMSNAGSINLQVDEVGANLSKQREALSAFLELYSGRIKNKLVKNTAEQQRADDLDGITPACMCMFGVPTPLLDGGKTEEDFMALLAEGFGRRCFFGWVDNPTGVLILKTPAEILASKRKSTSTSALKSISQHMEKLADGSMAHVSLGVPDDTALLSYEYENDCKRRADAISEYEELRRTEMRERHYKCMKLAAVYAYCSFSPEITEDHYLSAIALTEESGNAFNKILSREGSYIKLAKYLAGISREMTKTNLIEALPFYKKGTKADREEMMVQAIDHGYQNNIIIKRRFTHGIEFYSGETLRSNDLTKMIVSYSKDIADNYINTTTSWEKLYALTQKSDIHWINHHLGNGHRSDANCVQGFNYVVIDVDKGVSMALAKSMLREYKALFYTTKRHDSNADFNRYRILIPTNFELHLNADDFKEFMENLYTWLPFQSDSATGQRARKWLSFPGQYEYIDGPKLLDVMPFIPKTSKNTERKERNKDLDEKQLSNLEKWVLGSTGEGNRNNQLLRYALILVEAGISEADVQNHVLTLNAKLANELPESEVSSSIMKTVRSKILKRDAVPISA